MNKSPITPVSEDERFWLRILHHRQISLQSAYIDARLDGNTDQMKMYTFILTNITKHIIKIEDDHKLRTPINDKEVLHNEHEIHVRTLPKT